MFRKEFALLGMIFGLFLYGSIAFPGGVAQSLAAGTASVPTIESVGGWSALIAFLFFIAASILIAIIAASAFVFLMQRRSLEEVATSYNVDVETLRGMEPMQAYQMLSEKYPHSVAFENGESEKTPVYASRGVYISPAYSLETEETA